MGFTEAIAFSVVSIFSDGFTEKCLLRPACSVSREGIAILKDLAHQSGFKLCPRDRVDIPCMQFENANFHKTDYPLHFSLACGGNRAQERIDHSERIDGTAIDNILRSGTSSITLLNKKQAKVFKRWVLPQLAKGRGICLAPHHDV
jgi:hypothetical protein